MDLTTEVENRLGTPGGHGNRFIENSKNHDWNQNCGANPMTGSQRVIQLT